MTLPLLAKKNYYPKNRKKADRTRGSYRAKTSEGKARQLENLVKGRGKRRKSVFTSGQAVRGAKLTKSELAGMDIIEFATDVLGVSFNARPAQEVILRAQYGLVLDIEQLEIYKVLSQGNIYLPGSERAEGIFVLGARAGKSFLSSVIACYESIVRADRWRKYLNPGEKCYVIIVATRLLQAQQIIGASCLRMLENSRVAHFVDDAISTEIILTNDITIMSMPCNSTSGRGLPICCLILDELGWYRQEGPKQDAEIFKALRPRMSQFRGAKFLAISTPASKQGLLYDLYEEGMDSGRSTPGRLTVQGKTIFVNPTVDPEFLESEKHRDIDNYEREFLALFCEAMDSFLPADKLCECFTLTGDVPYNSRYRYHCAVDQSGLAGRDLFAMSIAHTEGKKVFVDVSRTWSTSDGDRIIAELREIIKPYGISTVAVDRYSGGWVKLAFERQGIEVVTRDLLPPIYVNLKSLVISGRVFLPDTKGLREGLVRTQAFYGRSNQLSIGHERTAEGHGDEADSAATAIWLASKTNSGGLFYL